MLTASAYRSTVEAAGATYFPPKQAPDRDDNQLARLYPSFRRLPNAEALARLFGDRAVAEAAAQGHDVAVASAAWKADALVNDGVTLGVPLAAGLLGLPWATVSPFLFCTIPDPALPPPFLGAPWLGQPLGPPLTAALDRVIEARLAGANRRWRRLAAAWRVPTPPERARLAGASPRLYLYPGGPPLEYPRRRWPSQAYGVGPLTAPPRAPAAGRPAGAAPATAPLDPPPWRLFLTEGTTHTAEGLAALALRALAAAPVTLTIALGERSPATLGPVPPNARLVGYVDYGDALRGADLLITNGGAGSLAAAFAAGVPALILPAGLDKPEAARRVAWSGAGRCLPSPRRCAADRFRTTVLAMAADPALRRRAGRVGRSLTALGGPARAAERLEDLLSDLPGPPC